MEYEIKIPTELKDITLRQYKAYEKIIKANVTDQYSERFINTKMLEIFCNIPFDYASKMKLNDFVEIVDKINAMLMQKPNLVKHFKMGDSNFGFIPNLEDMTFGEYIDLDQNIGDPEKIEYVMAVLYRPVKQQVGDRYSIKDYEPDLLREAMLNMPMDAVVSSILFFWNLGIDCTNAMTNYLSPKERALIRQQQEDLQINGGGHNQFTNSLKAILHDLKL
tara:strand:- start:4986 stop:5645 length:660 start_codon:yes stop_codon:yes gene_type:complete